MFNMNIQSSHSSIRVIKYLQRDKKKEPQKMLYLQTQLYVELRVSMCDKIIRRVFSYNLLLH